MSFGSSRLLARRRHNTRRAHATGVEVYSTH